MGEREDGKWCRLGGIGRPGGAGMMEGGVGWGREGGRCQSWGEGGRTTLAGGERIGNADAQEEEGDRGREKGRGRNRRQLNVFPT